ncbi:MAG TPA: hypothetical protein DIU15_03525 [Deltaproteobacteria bacterium]|nr:hypothetical protein [Deltaproteobacteria bacterium]HCP45083.1 hypothetical protein [Deltaproteobacteria bacterium]
MNIARTFLCAICMPVLLPAMLVGLAGCATASQGETWRPNELYDVEMVEAPDLYDDNGGFVYGGASLFSPKRARQIGDLLTIVVVQDTEAGSEASTSLKKTNEANSGVSALFGLETALAEIPGGGPTLDLSATAESGFDGSGSTGRKGSLKGTLTARVVKVLPNGHLVIAGRQAVKINNEVEVLGLRGIVDPKGISSTNTVLSTSIADARIEYSGTGVVAGKQRPGWMSRILDVVAPF